MRFEFVGEIILALMSFMFLGCEDNSTNHEISEATVELSQGQKADLGFDDLEVGFYRFLGDSRCPTNAYCEWPGIGEITVYLLQRPMHDPVYVRIAIVGTVNSMSEFNDVPAYVSQYQIRLMGLMPYPINSDPIDSSEYIARIKVARIDGPIPFPKIQLTHMEPSEIMLDSVQIDGLAYTGNNLQLQLSHGGCCKMHYYWLYMSPPGFTKSNPPQANLYLRHFDNADSCKCIGFDTLSFDLKPIRDLYDSTIGGNDSIFLNLFDYYRDSAVILPHIIVLHKE